MCPGIRAVEKVNIYGMLGGMMEVSTIADTNNAPAIVTQRILTMSDDEINQVRALEAEILAIPQVVIPTSHILHGGMYSRTIMVPAGVVLTGSLMKISTILIIQGDFLLFAGDGAKELHGYNVFAGGPHRKQSGLAQSDTWVTMIFPTDAKTVEEAERKFTDEYDMLASRGADAINYITITEQ